MNSEYDEINDNLHLEYRLYLESFNHRQLLSYFADMPKEDLIEIIQDRDPVGKGDYGYER